MSDPEMLPLRVAERYGRLFMWAAQLDIAPREHRVLVHLIGAGDKNLSSWWSFGRIGESIGMSDRSVARAVAELAAHGLITRRERRTDRGRNSDHITVLAPVEIAEIRENEEERRLHSHEIDVAEHRLGMRPDNLSGRSPSGHDKCSDEPSYLYEEDIEVSEGSPDNLSGLARRRGTPAASIFADIGRAA